MGPPLRLRRPDRLRKGPSPRRPRTVVPHGKFERQHIPTSRSPGLVRAASHIRPPQSFPRRNLRNAATIQHPGKRAYSTSSHLSGLQPRHTVCLSQRFNYRLSRPEMANPAHERGARRSRHRRTAGLFRPAAEDAVLSRRGNPHGGCNPIPTCTQYIRVPAPTRSASPTPRSGIVSGLRPRAARRGGIVEHGEAGRWSGSARRKG